MGRDKAFLDYHGQPQVEIVFNLLGDFCENIFISKRSDQKVPDKFLSSVINDEVEGGGPLAGIISAFRARGDCAWLVMACDLPYLNKAAIRYLVERRSGEHLATAYRSAHTGDPEPLCAVYESGISGILEAAFAQGEKCPRRILVRQDVFLIDLPDRRWLDNINTPQERNKVTKSDLSGGESGVDKTVHIRYYAALREARGQSGETLPTGAPTAARLYEDLQKKFNFNLNKDMLRVAINQEYVSWETPLNDQDEVVFVPPVNGG
jgi:molybdopterin-guanine dinucleotide biosynthesis protein A